ncbi:unnamed protein product [Periconia digitata]|uniref:Lysosomal dipeptide transporter MFSD1 n=1 Tax=Periconia digitata TaxID=1303443 RepID=A0A9W4UHG0_9PLEO|nr:unnamed protein product [Periconia digitata]
MESTNRIPDTTPGLADDDKDKTNAAVTVRNGNGSEGSVEGLESPPLRWKLMAIVLVTAIGFGSQWSSGITSAMKSTIKKEMKVNNKQFALLEASEDFMVTVLMLFSGVVTDRIGGANAILYGNIIYSVGSILVAGAAQTRSYKFMIGGRVIRALGDIATQVAQYKVFSSWFAPGNGFASTLGFELGIGKIGAFAGKSSANIIAKRTGDFAWVFWIAVFMNLFTNVMTVLFYWFTRIANKRFQGTVDPATGEQLAEKSKKLELRKVLQLPWTFWAVMAFSMFQTSASIVFLQNATELAEQRFGTTSIVAAWYSATAQYAGFFFVPLLGVFIDLLGQRITALAVCGILMFLAMSLVCFANTVQGTAASFGVFAFAVNLGPTPIIDSIRTSMFDSSVFGTAYALKITMNNAMNIIVRIVTGVIQDHDKNSYDRVTIVYVALVGAAVAVSIALLGLSWKFVDLRQLQWSRKLRITRRNILIDRKEVFDKGSKISRTISLGCFVALLVLTCGSWCAYFWGVATGKH